MVRQSRIDRGHDEQRARDEREAERASRRAGRRSDIGDDISQLASREADHMSRNADNPNAEEMDQEDMAWESGGPPNEDAKESVFSKLVEWIVDKRRVPPPEWRTFRREEIASGIQETRAGLLGYMPKAFDTYLYNLRRNRRIRYWGDRDDLGKRDGRGVCFWPDPPIGGGESYFGLWREDQPNGHGLFRWFDGDLYLGEWNIGKMQGYGVYQYGPDGQYAHDKYEGSYFQGLRQGSGVYKFAPKFGLVGAVYLGEWLRGKMHGHGMLTYADGESYVGQWRNDFKQGLGEYKWGWAAGEVAGDKYQGEFHEGFTHGVGCTVFADGGFHKGRYAKGKMNGYGRLQVSDGWEYVGTWKDDELHGEVVCFYAFGSGQGKEVQFYEMGRCMSTRAYDPTKDWGELESMGLSEARNADKMAEDAAIKMKHVGAFARKAKESQLMAKDAAEEAKYMTRASLAYKDYLLAWYGIKHIVTSEE